MQTASTPSSSRHSSVSTDSWISAPSRKPQPERRTPTLRFMRAPGRFGPPHRCGAAAVNDMMQRVPRVGPRASASPGSRPPKDASSPLIMPIAGRAVILALLAGCSPAKFMWTDDGAPELAGYRKAFAAAVGDRFTDAWSRQQLLHELAGVRVLWLGDHHRSPRLHALH